MFLEIILYTMGHQLKAKSKGILNEQQIIFCKHYENVINAFLLHSHASIISQPGLYVYVTISRVMLKLDFSLIKARIKLLSSYVSVMFKSCFS